MSNFYVRDADGKPQNISKIFVRDAAGDPKEVCKIYVRDANGVPQLVYTCETVIVECPTCGSGLVPIYYSGQSGSDALPPEQRPRFAPNNSTTDTGFVNTVVPDYSVNKQYWLKVSNYSRVRTPSTEREILDSDPIFKKREYILPENCEFCNNVDAPPATWLNSNLYWDKLNEAYQDVNVRNLPLIPGHIVTDWNSFSVRDTIFIIFKLLQRKFTAKINQTTGEIITEGICTHPETRATFGGGFYCPEPGVPVSVTKYPFYNRNIAFRFIPRGPAGLPDPDLSWCGQESCNPDLFGTSTSYATDCYGSYVTQGGFFTPENLPSFCCGVDEPNCQGVSSSGSTSLDVYRCRCCDGVIGPDNPEENCRDPFDSWPTCTELNPDGWCGCKTFFGSTTIPPEENPFIFLVARENHGTFYTVPTLQTGHTLQDCCSSSCYGPIDYDTVDKPEACREVTQLPPINTLGINNFPTGTEGSEYIGAVHTDNLSFFRDFGISVLMDSRNVGGSNASVRVVLPYYVTLDDRLKANFIEINESAYDNFINNGDGPSQATSGQFYEQHLSIWNAVRGILGFAPGAPFITPINESEKIWMASNHFQYYEFPHAILSFESTFIESNGANDRRFEEIAIPWGRRDSEKPLRVTPVGCAYDQWPLPFNKEVFDYDQDGDIDNADWKIMCQNTLANNTTPGGPNFPVNSVGLNWSIKGYPTEKSTHYVAIEMMFNAQQNCRNSLLKLSDMYNAENQKFVIKGIKFYPLHRTCKNGSTYRQNKYHRYPLFENYIVPEAPQKYSRLDDYLGFVDKATRNNNTGVWSSFTPSNYDDLTDPLSGNPVFYLNTQRTKNFWNFTHPNTGVQTIYELIYPPAAGYGVTYAGFLKKHYRRRV
jgi:hypothetical protein